MRETRVGACQRAWFIGRADASRSHRHARRRRKGSEAAGCRYSRQNDCAWDCASSGARWNTFTVSHARRAFGQRGQRDAVVDDHEARRGIAVPGIDRHVDTGRFQIARAAVPARAANARARHAPRPRARARARRRHVRVAGQQYAALRLPDQVDGRVGRRIVIRKYVPTDAASDGIWAGGCRAAKRGEKEGGWSHGGRQRRQFAWQAPPERLRRRNTQRKTVPGERVSARFSCGRSARRDA